MPKENKKRGRRGEKNRSRKDVDTNTVPLGKRRKLHPESEPEPELELELELEELPLSKEVPEPIEQSYDHPSNPADIPFYGLLDEDEQAYFKRVDAILELDQFVNDEERELFVANVYREAAGKELKIANSQSCSRLLERLICMSTPDQLKVLFQKFSEHLLSLVQHRFASHCCETLLLQSAPAVTQELLAPITKASRSTEDAEASISMESLFLNAAWELQENLGFLMTDQFGSHVVRILLTVLSGGPLRTLAATSVFQSKKKEKIGIVSSKRTDAQEERRTVPESFSNTLDEMLSDLTAGLTTGYLRTLAIHPVANPVLQLLVELEFSRAGKSAMAKDDKSLFRKLLPDDPLTEDTPSAAFVRGLLYDPVGSRLLETIVTFAPGKVFKAMYNSLLRERIGDIVKNEIAGYVVVKVLERLSHNDLQHAMERICLQIPTLLERSQTSIIKTLIERCIVRSVSIQTLADTLNDVYSGDDGALLTKLLKVNGAGMDGVAPERRAHLEAQDASKLHGSLLAQEMLKVPGPLRATIVNDMLKLDAPSLLNMARDRTATHVLQRTLTCQEQTKAVRRKLVQLLTEQVLVLVIDPIASHVVDVMWTATGDLFFLREQTAEELQRNEVKIRESFSGRAVWRNWMMDLYKRRKVEWISRAKGFGINSDLGKPRSDPIAAKTGIELARERFAATRAGKARGPKPSRPKKHRANGDRHSSVAAEATVT